MPQAFNCLDQTWPRAGPEGGMNHDPMHFREGLLQGGVLKNGVRKGGRCFLCMIEYQKIRPVPEQPFHRQRAIVILENLCRQIRSEEHTSELQSRPHLVCRLLLE